MILEPTKARVLRFLMWGSLVSMATGFAFSRGALGESAGFGYGLFGASLITFLVCRVLLSFSSQWLSVQEREARRQKVEAQVNALQALFDQAEARRQSLEAQSRYRGRMRRIQRSGEEEENGKKSRKRSGASSNKAQKRARMARR